MRTGIRRRRQVIQRSRSAAQALGWRSHGGCARRVVLAALVAVGLSMALAGPAPARGPPTVSNIVPKHAPHLGGTSVTIIGTNFTGATAVTFGTSGNAPSFTVNSSTQITAVSPPGGEGTSVQVGVVTPAGGSPETTADFFFYQKSCEEGKAPAVTSVEPNSGPAGTRVIIRGERFFEGACTPPVGFSVERVLFGFNEATSFTRNFDELQAVSPPGTGAVDVTVESFLGQSPVTPRAFFIGPAPTIYHWYRSGVKLPESTSIPIVMFGGKVNLAQQLVGEINCRTVAGGTIENPVGGGAGVGRTNSMSFYECKQPKCEEEVKAKTGLEGRGRLTSENNPAATQEPAFPGWSDSLEESTVAGVNSVREKIGEPWETFKTLSPLGMWRETQICEVAPTRETVAAFIYEGELKPEIGVAKSGNLNGISGSQPSTIKFEGASTEDLLSEVGGEGTFKGQLKYLGYNEQELIAVKP